MLARALAIAGSCWPMWWVSAPQQPAPSGHHHLDAQAGQQADRGVVDLRVPAPAGRSRPAGRPVPCARPRPDARRARCRRRRGSRRRAPAPASRGARWPSGSSAAGSSPAQRPRPAPAAASATRNRADRGSTAASSGAQRPLVPGAAIGAFDIGRAHDRPGACSSRRTGRWSCRTGRTGSGRHGDHLPRSPRGRIPACP